MQRGNLQRAWKAWRATIVAVAAVIAIGSLASASPSLRAPRGPHEPLVTGPTGTTEVSGPTGPSGPNGSTDPEIEPAEEETDPPSEGADFSACEGLTGLDNAICRHEALLVVQPDNQGLQNSLAHLQEDKAEHEAKSDEDGGDVPPSEDGSPSSSNHGHGQSEESHGNAGGNGASSAGGNGKDH
jgi:hypothetical protein